MFKKTILLITALLLTSCQLAQNNLSSFDSDEFIGYYLTLKPIEKFELKTKLEDEGENNIPRYTMSVDDSDLEGYLSIVTRSNYDQNFSGTMQFSDELALSPYSFTSNQANDFVTTFNFTNKKQDSHFYFNEVYQRPNGTLYVSANEVGYGMGNGESFGLLKQSGDTNFRLFVRNVDSLGKATVYQYNKAGELLDSTIVDPSSTSFATQPTADYIIVAQEFGSYLNRELINSSDEVSSYPQIFDFKIENEDGTISTRHIEISWSTQ